MRFHRVAQIGQRIIFGTQVSLTWLNAGTVAAGVAIVSEFAIDGLHECFGFLSERQWVVAHRYMRRICIACMIGCGAIAAYHFGECLAESCKLHPLTAHSVSFATHGLLAWLMRR